MNSSTFFIQHLIPAAQAFELMVDFLSVTWASGDRKRLGAVKEAFNIVAIKAMAADDKLREQLAAELDRFILTLRFGQDYKRFLLNALKLRGAHLSRTGTQNAALTGTRATFSTASWAARHDVVPKFEALKEHAAKLEAMCGYRDDKRNEFLVQHESTTLGNKPSAWTTLVRNGRWGLTLEKLGLMGDIAEVPDLEKHFGSFEGTRRLPSLWQEWFGDTYDVALGGVRPQDMLPVYVTVRSTPAGALLLTYLSPGKEAYSPEELTTITNVVLMRESGSTVPASLDVVNLDRKTLTLEVPWAKMGEALAEVEAWRAGVKAKVVAKLGEAKRFLEQKKLSSLRQTLEKSLDPKTLKLLQEALSKGENPLSDAALLTAGAKAAAKPARLAASPRAKAKAKA